MNAAMAFRVWRPFGALALLAVGACSSTSTTGSSVGSSTGASSSGSTSAVSSSGGGSTTSSSSSAASGTSGSSGSSGSTSGSAGSSGAGTSSTTGTSGSPCGGQTCAEGYCDADYNQCCPSPTGATLYVDGASSFEPACCGGSQAQACGSLTHAMDTVLAAGLRGATLEVYNSDKTIDWQVSQTNLQERWPIALGLGVTVHAPNIDFNPPARTGAFVIQPLAANDNDRVTIKGDPLTPVPFSFNVQGPVGIGFGSEIPVDSNGSPLSIPLSAPTAIAIGGAEDGGGPSLALSSVQLGGSSLGLDIGPGARVFLGPLPVLVGPTATAPLADGLTGVRCQGPGAELTDTPDGGWGTALSDAGVLAISGEAKLDLLAGDGCQASLTQGFSALDGVLVLGKSTLQLGGPTLASLVQGLGESAVGINLEADDGGAPQVTVSDTTVFLSGCAGIFVNAGSLKLSQSRIIGNGVGVMASGAARAVDLSGDGGAATASAVWCNGQSIGDLKQCPGLPGVFGTAVGENIPYLEAVDVYNHTAGLSIDAENVLWDTYSTQPRIFTCDDSYTCSCSGPDCPPWATPQSLLGSYYGQFIAFVPPTIIEAFQPLSFDGGLPIDTANGGQYVPAPGETCPPQPGSPP